MRPSAAVFFSNANNAFAGCPASSRPWLYRRWHRTGWAMRSAPASHIRSICRSLECHAGPLRVDPAKKLSACCSAFSVKEPQQIEHCPASGNAFMITVLGSINMDLIATVDRLPRARRNGFRRNSFETDAGGKGANQALAARRAGADGPAWSEPSAGTSFAGALACPCSPKPASDLTAVRTAEGSTGTAAYPGRTQRRKHNRGHSGRQRNGQRRATRAKPFPACRAAIICCCSWRYPPGPSNPPFRRRRAQNVVIIGA